jgi:hypothetical protein
MVGTGAARKITLAVVAGPATGTLLKIRSRCPSQGVIGAVCRPLD